MMSDPARVSFWTAMAAFAGFLQVVVLGVTARFVWRYLKATENLVRSTVDQVSESRKLVEAAQRQVDASLEQVEETKKLVFAERRQTEAQIKPAVVARMKWAGQQQLVELMNIGNGPALDVKLSAMGRGSVERWDDVNEPFARELPLAFIERGADRETGIRIRPVQGLVGEVPVLGERSLRCEYRSLSGRTYSTIVGWPVVCGGRRVVAGGRPARDRGIRLPRFPAG
jgi:hypothetical protein